MAQEITIRIAKTEDISRIIEIREKTFQHFAPSAYSP